MFLYKSYNLQVYDYSDIFLPHRKLIYCSFDTEKSPFQEKELRKMSLFPYSLKLSPRKYSKTRINP